MKMLLQWGLLSVLAVPTFALDTPRLFKQAEPAPELPTIFNGIEVPPMRELSPDTFEPVTKDGYW